jgi:hypothetical protein
MKKTNFKWVMIWIVGILATLSAIYGGTGLQLIPLFGFVALGYFDVKLDRHLSVAIMVLSIIMTIINMSGIPSWIDVIVWLLILFAWI